MFFGVVGVVAFILALYVIGAIAERNGAKVVKFGGALAVCALVLIVWGEPAKLTDADCYTDWDGFSNPTVCD